MNAITLSGREIIKVELDIIAVRKSVRVVASDIGFGGTDVTRIVTAASELARNILRYAGSGWMDWRVLQESSKTGIELTFEDQGPGIADVALAMQPNYSSCGSLGMGLPGSKRLMDELDIKSVVGTGTTIVIRKWLR